MSTSLRMKKPNLQYGYTHQCKNDEVQNKIIKTKLQEV